MGMMMIFPIIDTKNNMKGLIIMPGSNRKAIKQQCPRCGKFRIKKEMQVVNSESIVDKFKKMVVWWCENCQIGDEY